LYRDFESIAAIVRRPGLTEAEVRDARVRAGRLDRYRDGATDAWITLVQAEIDDWAAGRTDEPTVAEARRARILELGDALFLGDSAPE
jgi:hypothetical protein